MRRCADAGTWPFFQVQSTSTNAEPTLENVADRTLSHTCHGLRPCPTEVTWVGRSLLAAPSGGTMTRFNGPREDGDRLWQTTRQAGSATFVSIGDSHSFNLLLRAAASKDPSPLGLPSQLAFCLPTLQDDSPVCCPPFLSISPSPSPPTRFPSTNTSQARSARQHDPVRREALEKLCTTCGHSFTPVHSKKFEGFLGDFLVR
jgi:hypothetical protein